MPTAPIASAPTLYNTGQAADYSLLANCAADNHWAGVTVATIPAWNAEGGPSRWVSLTCAVDQPPGNYEFGATFTVPVGSGITALHGRIAYDNEIAAATLDGAAITLPAGAFGDWMPFSLPVTEGARTLHLTIRNLPDQTATNNPVGLRVEWLSADVPTPPVTLTAVGQIVNGQPAIVLTVT